MVRFIGKSLSPSRWRVARAGPGRDSLAGLGHQSEILDSDKHDWYNLNRYLNADSDSQSDCRPSPPRIRFQESYSLSASESELVTQWLGLRGPSPSLEPVTDSVIIMQPRNLVPSSLVDEALLRVGIRVLPCRYLASISAFSTDLKRNSNSTQVKSFQPIGQAAAWQQCHCIHDWAPASHLAITASG